MPDDATVRHSLAYRKAETQIQRGDVPAKYTRLLPYIEGKRIIEIGAAEGVLSLLLAERGAYVVGVELRPERHDAAVQLKQRWRALGRDVERCAFVCGDIRDRLQLMDMAETLVAVRALYYLRAHAADVLTEAHARGVRRVVLVGNGNRAAQYRREPNTELGRFNRLSSVDGMADVLERSGYAVVKIVPDGDPIVVGNRPNLAA